MYIPRDVCLIGYVSKRMSFLFCEISVIFHRVDFSRVKLSLLLYPSVHSAFTYMNSFDGGSDLGPDGIFVCILYYVNFELFTE